MNRIVKKYDFFKTKYGDELLIDLIRLESLEKYISEGCPHYLTYYDITLVTGGKGFFNIDHDKYPIQEGIVLFSSPGQIRHWDFELLPTGYVLIFEEEFLSCFLNDSQFISNLKYFNTLSNQPELELAGPDTRYLIKLMEDIEQEVRTFNENDKQILRAQLYQTLVWLNRKYITIYPDNGKNDFNRYIRQYTELVNREFIHHHAVSYYARALSVTEGHLNDLCKSHLGINAKQYIQNRIITEAKRLLLYSDLQVCEIALHLNFEDVSYFVRKFRQVTGMTPLSFRKTKNP
ncbi:MAG: helix-turn-helix transcriptional regulator [Mangrovibacterium sp.]